MSILARAVDGVALRFGYVRLAQRLVREEKLRHALTRCASDLKKLRKLNEALMAASLRDQRVKEELARARESNVDLSARVAAGERELKEERARFKTRSAELTARVASFEQRVHDLAGKWQAATEELAALKGNVHDATGNLMLVEAKLDILEGAANVLDRRLREARQR